MRAKEPLRRKGSSLMGSAKRWQMMAVHGPLETRDEGEVFRIETASHDTLLVCRQPGERGMRELYLLAVLQTKAG